MGREGAYVREGSMQTRLAGQGTAIIMGAAAAATAAALIRYRQKGKNWG